MKKYLNFVKIISLILIAILLIFIFTRPSTEQIIYKEIVAAEDSANYQAETKYDITTSYDEYTEYYNEIRDENYSKILQKYLISTWDLKEIWKKWTKKEWKMD